LISSLGIPDPRNVVSRKTSLHRCGEAQDLRHILLYNHYFEKIKNPLPVSTCIWLQGASPDHLQGF
jgi:hypothetical protein